MRIAPLLIYFHDPFWALHLSLSLMAKTTAQSVCKNNWLFVCLFKSLPSACFVLLYNFLFMRNAYCFLSEEAGYFFRKSCVDFNFISLIHFYVYIHIALCYQELYIQDSCKNWPCNILYSKNYQQLFKHWLLKLSKIS